MTNGTQSGGSNSTTMYILIGIGLMILCVVISIGGFVVYRMVAVPTTTEPTAVDNGATDQTAGTTGENATDAGSTDPEVVIIVASPTFTPTPAEGDAAAQSGDAAASGGVEAPASTDTVVVEPAPVAEEDPTLTALLDLNIRRGPYITPFNIVGALRKDTPIKIIGKPSSATLTWVKIECPPPTTGECWITSASGYATTTSLDKVPVVEVPKAPPQPQPQPQPATATAAATATATPTSSSGSGSGSGSSSTHTPTATATQSSSHTATPTPTPTPTTTSITVTFKVNNESTTPVCTVLTGASSQPWTSNVLNRNPLNPGNFDTITHTYNGPTPMMYTSNHVILSTFGFGLLNRATKSSNC